MGLKSDACTEDVIDALLAELARLGQSSADAAAVWQSANTHVEQLRAPYDPTWTIQALDGVVRQMNQRGFRHVVAEIIGGSGCTPAEMTSFRLESLTDSPGY